MPNSEISQLPRSAAQSTDIIPIARPPFGPGSNYGITVASISALTPAASWATLTGDLTETQVIPWDGGTVGTPDSGISRIGVASLAIGNGTAGDYTGSLTLGKLFAGDGTIVGGSGNTPGIAFRTGTDTGFAHSGSTGNTNQVLYTILDGYEVVVNDISFGATICETQALGFSAGAYTSRDLSLSRLGAGVLGLGNGVYNNANGQLNLRTVLVALSGTLTSVLDDNGVSVYNGNYLRFSGGNVLGTVDAGISRLGAASLAIGNGTAGNTSGNLSLNRVNVAGIDFAGTATITAAGTSVTVTYAANYTGAAAPVVVVTPTSDPLAAGIPVGYWVVATGSTTAWTGFTIFLQAALAGNITFNFIVIGKA